MAINNVKDIVSRNFIFLSLKNNYNKDNKLNKVTNPDFFYEIYKSLNLILVIYKGNSIFAPPKN